MKRLILFGFPLTLLIAFLVAALAPLERTLGANARLVYLHGAWVWEAMLMFALAALTGLAGLVLQRPGLQHWSRALGRTGLVFWLTFLPMSLYVMQANWNGLFLDEPRFRVPLNLAVVGLLLQIGLSFFPIIWTALANVLYGTALILSMGSIQTVLHPDSPIFNPNAGDIQNFFFALLALLTLTALQISVLLRGWKKTD